MKKNTKSEKKINKFVAIIFFGTLVSRITGYIRDVIFASFFGTGMISESFITAFKIPNLFRRLIGENYFNLVFIPIFIEYKLKKGEKLANKLAISTMKILFIFLGLITLIGLMVTPLILRAIAPGFSEIPDKVELTIKLTRIMFPYIIFTGISSLCMGILNTLEDFSTPSFNQLLLNISMIIFLYSSFIIYQKENFMVTNLSLGVLFGGFLQFLVMLLALIKKNFFYKVKSNFWHSEFKKIGYSISPSIVVSIIYQINSTIGNILASFLKEGSIAYLYYADRIVQFPIGIFAHAFSTAIMPKMSKAISSKNFNHAIEIFSNALKSLIFIILPSTAGLIVLREPIVTLLFGRGAFDTTSIKLTSDALFCYAIGLFSFSLIKLFIPLYFALNDSKTPAKYGCYSLIINVILGLVLMNYFNHCGLALAASISSIINLIILIISINKKTKITIPWFIIAKDLIKTSICTILMSLVTLILKYFLISYHTKILPLSISLFLCIICGILSYAIFSFVFKIPQFYQFLFLMKILKTK